MDGTRFDILTRALAAVSARASRRASLRFLAAGTVLPTLDRLGTLEAEAKKKKSKKKKKKKPVTPACQLDTDCSDCKTCVNGQCTDLFPLCDEDKCEAAECDAATRSWLCTDGCAEIGGECCDGDCLDPCPSDLSRDPDDCTCAGQCPAGREFCEEIRYPQDPCCQVGEVCCGRWRCCGTDEHCCPVGPRGPGDTDCCPNDARCYRDFRGDAECCPNDWLRCEDWGCSQAVDEFGDKAFCCNDGTSGACIEGRHQCCIGPNNFSYCCPADKYVCDTSDPTWCRYVG